MKKILKEIGAGKLVLLYLLIVLSIGFISLRSYILIGFESISFEQLIYSAINTEGASASSIVEGALFVLTWIFGGIIIFTCYLFFNYSLSKKIVIKIKNKYICLFPFKNNIIHYFIIAIFSFVYFLYGLGFFQYIENKLDSSLLYEENYVNPNDVEIVFPESKRNLIYIFLESMENSALSKKNGGTVEESYIPRLEELALDNINFSHNNKIGGAIATSNTGWTIAALIAQTSGTTLNTFNIDGNSFGGYSEFLPGVTSIGEILSNEGYINYFMLGSDSVYGGRRKYFKQHGYYYIYDYYTALEKEKFSNYYVWWGYEDKKLFEYAKEELLKLSDGDQPFNFTMLTVDTHFIDGYLDETCETPFDKQYANVFNCSSNMVYDFVSWIKEQDFYDNTTIVIVGDHSTMQNDFFERDKDYQRTVYNTFINSAIDTKYSKNREFSTLDMFPTTLASLGVKIKGDRLGLGTNLFSGKKTLFEEFGVDYVNSEILKNSNYYNEKILGNTYYEIKGYKKNTK